MGERVDPVELSSNLLALPEELSSNLLPEGCTTNVDSTWSQGLDLAPAFGGAVSQRAESQGSAAFHAPAVFVGGVVSQEQHEAALAAARALSVPLRRRLQTQAAAAEKELLKLSFAHAVELREAREQHERSATTAQQQHDQMLAALQKQLVERKTATEKALLEASASKAAALTAAQENEKLWAAVAAANLRAGEAEARAGAAEARAALVFAALEPPWMGAEPELASPPPECSSASSSGDSAASRSDVGDSGDSGGSGDDGPSCGSGYHNNNYYYDDDNDNGSMRGAGQSPGRTINTCARALAWAAMARGPPASPVPAPRAAPYMQTSGAGHDPW